MGLKNFLSRARRVVEVVNDHSASAFHNSLGGIDAGVAIVVKLAFERLECMLQHLGVTPVRANALIPGYQSAFM